MFFTLKLPRRTRRVFCLATAIVLICNPSRKQWGDDQKQANNIRPSSLFADASLISYDDDNSLESKLLRDLNAIQADQESLLSAVFSPDSASDVNSARTLFSSQSTTQTTNIVINNNNPNNIKQQQRDAVHKVITVGYIRMTGLDDSSVLATMLATIREANLRNNKRTRLERFGDADRDHYDAGDSTADDDHYHEPDLGFTIKLDVVTVDCADTRACAMSLASIDESYTTPTIDLMVQAASAVGFTVAQIREFLDSDLYVSATNWSNVSLPSTTLPPNPADGEAMLLAFFARIPYYSLIFRPNHVIAPRVIEHVKRLGHAKANLTAMMKRIPSVAASMRSAEDDENVFTAQSNRSLFGPSSKFIPIINPESFAKADAEDTDGESENLIRFDHYIDFQLAHLFTFMQQSSACAYSGIVHQQVSEINEHIDVVQKMFADGGLPVPPALDVSSPLLTDQALMNFFFDEEPRRRCFFALTTATQLQATVARLVNISGGKYDPRYTQFYGTSLAAQSKFSLPNGNTDAFDVHFTRWSPPYEASNPKYQLDAAQGLKKVYDQWLSYVFSNTSGGLTVDTSPAESARQAYLTYYNASVAAVRAAAASGNASAGIDPEATQQFWRRTFESTSAISIDGAGPSAANGIDLSGFSIRNAVTDVIPEKPTDGMFASYLILCIALENIKSVVAKRGVRSIGYPITNGPLEPTLSSRVNFNSTTVASSVTTTFAGVNTTFVDFVLPVRLDSEGVLNAFYDEARTFGGYAFHRLVRSCSALPFSQNCFCNAATRTSYVYHVAPGMGGVPQAVFDNAARGQKDMSSISFSQSCRYATSSWSYPLTAFFLFPEVRQELIMPFLFEATFTEMVRVTNYAPTPPARPFRYAPFTVPTGFSTATVLQQYTASYNPFVIFGSLQDDILESDVLTLFPSVQFETEDPVLKPMYVVAGAGNGQSSGLEDEDRPFGGTVGGSARNHRDDYWQTNLLRLQPVLADYVMTLAQYYSRYQDIQFNGYPIRAVATTPREAELIALSFGSVGILLETKDIVVSSDADEWDALITGWLSEKHPEGILVRETVAFRIDPQTNLPTNTVLIEDVHFRVPFVIAASTSNPNRVINRAFAAAKRVDRGILAVAGFDTTVHNSTNEAADIAVNTNRTGSRVIRTVIDSSTAAPEAEAELASTVADIVFTGMAPEWWVNGSRRYQGIPSSLDAYRQNPRFLTALIAFEFTSSLASSVQQDYTLSAAEVLYSTQPSIVTRAGTFGPFSNKSCTDEEILANTHDRTCQCTKGPRTFYAHSVKDRILRQPSARTDQFSYTLSTCGVVYTPYVPPPAAAKSLSKGAIAGIAVGCSVLVIGLIAAAILVNMFCFGRNNRAAPKDGTKPFTIAFTDIQSSTALWARAPSAMSEAIEDHHAILRKALRRNDGYEVKTVGDSFMVAFKEADDGVKFALDAQVMLKEDDCWSTEIDAIYLELLAEAEQEEHVNLMQLQDETDFHKSQASATTHTANVNVNGDRSPPQPLLAVSIGTFGASHADDSHLSPHTRPNASVVNHYNDQSQQMLNAVSSNGHGTVGSGGAIAPAPLLRLSLHEANENKSQGSEVKPKATRLSVRSGTDLPHVLTVNEMASVSGLQNLYDPNAVDSPTLLNEGMGAFSTNSATDPVTKDTVKSLLRLPAATYPTTSPSANAPNYNNTAPNHAGASENNAVANTITTTNKNEPSVVEGRHQSLLHANSSAVEDPSTSTK